MANQEASILPTPSPEHRRIAAGQFDHANQVIASGKNYDYGIRLLLSCCKLDPANLIYRQALRRAQKLKFNNNMRGSLFAWLTTFPSKAKLKRAKQNRDWILVLELGEYVLNRNPWDVGTQKDMADAAEHLGLIDFAIWSLTQARQKDPDNPNVNRLLALLSEQRGNFAEAINLWEQVRKAKPENQEAASKLKDLAAHETIARGNYQGAISGKSGRIDEDVSMGPRSSSGRRSSSKKHKQSTTTAEEPASASSHSVGGKIQQLLAQIQDNPANPEPYLILSNTYRRKGELAEAQKVLQEGLVPTNNHFDLTLALADLEIEPFRKNLGITEERLQQNSTDEELRKIRIRLLKEINARELELFRQKADRHPNDMNHHFELGVRLLRAGQTDEAIEELQTARSERRLLWSCAMYLGHSFKARKNWRLAKRNFTEALEAMPKNETEPRKEVLFNLAQGCAEANDLSEAIEWGNELANLDFRYKNIHQLLDDWETQLAEQQG